eukprot:gb/GECH01008970.1/.p1 GENE.gb/GECH01008970.1/~~gb/GECH01008970.1/.p1  ORF type:complete len:581 (+),score=50.26 gb/GECH01008970.1/:1-1743(+)
MTSPTSSSSFPFERPPPPPSRWRSPEFIVYLSQLSFAFLLLFLSAFNRSSCMIVFDFYRLIYTFSNVSVLLNIIYNRLIGVLERYGHNPSFKQGWLGRKMDLSDLQWNEFRLKLPLLFVGACIFIIVSNLVKKFSNSYKTTLIFYWISSIGFLLYVHGSHSFWVISIVVINYSIAKKFKDSRLNPTITWIFNLSILYLSYRYRGFPFRLFSSKLAFLDQWGGVLAWETYFKVSLCRLISFNMDYYFALQYYKNNINSSKTESNNFNTQQFWSAYRVRQETHLREDHYNFPLYFAYAFYIPLYIAGPICSFNAFASQVMRPLNNYSWRYYLQLFLRWMLILLLLEVSLHFNFYHAVNEYGYWRQPEVRCWELGFMGLWVLTFMYMKFLVIWRFFRLWSLLDGIDVPPNMIRCVYNNFSFTGFWRSWHSSLNKWIVRYLYRPLGGSRTQIYSIWLIFTFIGLWHDLWWRWVAWAWLNCIFFSMEILIMKSFFYSKIGQRVYVKPYFRHILAVCGSGNILLLMAANLAILHGFKGTYVFFRKFILSYEALYTIPFWSWVLFIAVQIMIEIRNEERRRNIFKNC